MGNDRGGGGGFPWWPWFSPFARSVGVALRGGDIVATSLPPPVCLTHICQQRDLSSAESILILIGCVKKNQFMIHDPFHVLFITI